jgi:hypothetical protein
MGGGLQTLRQIALDHVGQTQRAALGHLDRDFLVHQLLEGVGVAGVSEVALFHGLAHGLHHVLDEVGLELGGGLANRGARALGRLTAQARQATKIMVARGAAVQG